MNRKRNILILSPITISVLVLATMASAGTTESPPIIDVHLHAHNAWGPGYKACIGDFVYPPVDPKQGGTLSDLTDGPDFLIAPNSNNELMQRTLDMLEAYNITAIASGSLSRVAQWKNKAPKRIVRGILFQQPSDMSVSYLRNLITSKQVVVFGEICPQYQGLAPGDPLLEPYFALAEELDIPVGIHMGLGPPGTIYVGPPQYRATLTNPLLLEDVMIRHPQLRIYVMHAGWPMLDEMIHLLYSHPQVYVDVGIINWGIPRAEFYFYLKRLMDSGFGRRIMFGSDQMIWPDAIPVAIETIESADFLTEEQKRDIFYNNAVRFFRTDFSEALDQ